MAPTKARARKRRHQLKRKTIAKRQKLSHQSLHEVSENSKGAAGSTPVPKKAKKNGHSKNVTPCGPKLRPVVNKSKEKIRKNNYINRIKRKYKITRSKCRGLNFGRTKNTDKPVSAHGYKLQDVQLLETTLNNATVCKHCKRTNSKLKIISISFSAVRFQPVWAQVILSDFHPVFPKIGVIWCQNRI